MKKNSIYYFNILIASRILAQQTPPQVQTVNESEVNTKIKELETQKATIETRL